MQHNLPLRLSDRQGGDPRRGSLLLEGTSGSDRGDIVQEIITIVSEVARGLQPDCYDPLDDAMPGG